MKKYFLTLIMVILFSFILIAGDPGLAAQSPTPAASTQRYFA
jgi:hypothetical protein